MQPVIVYPELMNQKDDLFQNSDQNECNFSADGSEIPDFSDACLKFISDILLEEDLDENPISVEEYAALLETEKSLHDALECSAKGDTLGHKANTPRLDRMIENLHSSECSADGDTLTPLLDSVVENFQTSECSAEGDTLARMDHAPWLDTMVGNFHSTDCFSSYLEENGKNTDDVFYGYCVNGDTIDGSIVKPLMGLDDSSVLKSSNSCDDSGDGATTRTSSPVSILSPAGQDLREKFPNHGKKNRHRDADEGYVEGRNNKQQASYNEDYVEMKQYDDVLLSKEYNCDISYNDRMSNELSEEWNGKVSRRRASRGKKQNSEAEEVDLRTLLSQCAQAVSSFDLRSANEILKQIRQHSTPYGDSLQRVAYLFANGLEARLAGTGSSVGSDFGVRMSSTEFLKAYKAYMSAIPFKRTSYFIANNAILKLAEKSTKIHIIDFGISLGLQWPCFIQNLSKMSPCPPKLRITGIDYPKQGFRPAERVEATGGRLSGYCDRFNVQFVYHPIAQKWDTIQVEDLKIKSDELVIVNCMYRSALLLDELVDTNSPRDDFLRLIRKINPRLFIHGTVNGTFNAPFFITRFREALFHYSSLFDLFEATMAREDRERLLIETEIYGKEISNVVACEVAERIQRPETYKQWQVRTTRGGLRQVALDKGLLSRAKAMVKANYHKDFVVDEDRHWILQGWKGRILYGLSFWQPN